MLEMEAEKTVHEKKFQVGDKVFWKDFDRGEVGGIIVNVMYDKN